MCSVGVLGVLGVLGVEVCGVLEEGMRQNGALVLVLRCMIMTGP